MNGAMAGSVVPENSDSSRSPGMANGGTPRLGATYTSRPRGLAVSVGNGCIGGGHPSLVGGLHGRFASFVFAQGGVARLESERNAVTLDHIHACRAIALHCQRLCHLKPSR